MTIRTSLIHRSILAALLTASLLVSLGCSETEPVARETSMGVGTGSLHAAASTEPAGLRVQRVRADDLTEQLVATLEEGRLATVDTLRRVGLGEVVDDIVRVDGYQAHDLSSEALVREVYRRAEAHTQGQGERVLAHLYAEAEAEFGALRDDPVFSRVRALAAELGPQGLDPATFRFAPAQAAAQVQVSPALNRAIEQLSYVYAQPHLSQFRGPAVRHFRAPGFNFDSIVAESTNSRDAIVRMFQRGTPPPRAEVAAEAILRETLSQNGALKQHRAILASIEELRGELGLERLDVELRSYVDHEDRLPSRQAQAQQAATTPFPAKVAKPESDDVIRAVRHAAKGVETGAVAGNGARGTAEARTRAAQHYSDYVTLSFEPPDETASSSPGGGGGEGGGGGGRASDGTGSRSSTYNSDRGYRTGSPGSSYRSARGGASGSEGSIGRGAGGGGRVSRRFGVAIRSARAARGIAAGAPVTSSASRGPVTAVWTLNREDGRFGRLVVGMEAAAGTPPIAASRTLIADSFYAACSLLWGGHYGSTAYRDGNILVLMSMDPFVNPDPQRAAELEKRAEEIRGRALMLDEDDASGRAAVFKEFMGLRLAAQRMPRRVVFHPALFGREMAWSAARIDFWFNDLEGLSREAAMMNGGTEMPARFRTLEVGEASTWQFYERDSIVDLVPESRRVGKLVVRSTGPDELGPSTRSHFAVSMFAFNVDATASDEGRPLPELSQRIQPMLDWLAINHHDFMRLNDLSESFTLLRWLGEHDVAPLLLDMDGEAPEIATPDRVVIGEGPQVGH